MIPGLGRRQQGQIMVMAAAVLSFLFVPLTVFVVDSALVEANYAQLGETLQAATEDGASAIDENTYRQSGGHRVVLDSAAAKATCERSLTASGMPGLESWTVTVTGNRVTASATVHVTLLIVGQAHLTETRSAGFAFGQ